MGATAPQHSEGSAGGSEMKMAGRPVGRVSPRLVEEFAARDLEVLGMAFEIATGAVHGIELRWHPAIRNVQIECESVSTHDAHLEVEGWVG